MKFCTTFAMLFSLVSSVYGAPGNQPESYISIDSLRAPLCQVPKEALKSCASGNARFHLDAPANGTEVTAHVISVAPELYLGWAECVAKKWHEFNENRRLKPDLQGDVTVTFKATCL
jgi:hypothetical protein